MKRSLTFCNRALIAAAIAAGTVPAESQAPAASAPTYADLADLALAAPIAAQVRIAGAVAVKDARATGLRAGFARLFVEADLVSLIRSPQSLPARLRYVVDLPRDSKGKAPKLRKGSEFLLLAAPVAGRPGELRLIAPDAQLPFTAERAATLRSIVREASSASPPPRIAGIGRAFHVPGAIRGESETQIFLQTADNRPISLSILRRPGETPRWSVALGEMVDDAAASVRRDTLLWYRLACTLPATLPASSLSETSAAESRAVQADYRLVLQDLGRCNRTRSRS